MTETTISELLPAQELPADHDPLAEGILMAHQAAWLADESWLKLAEKGRRTGITYAEALDDTLLAAKSRSAGGDNVFYIGDSRDKGLEFIRYCAHFARVVAKELHAAAEEFLFDDARKDGTTSRIAAYRIKFASGFQIVALSSRPANIRGLQGTVVIDEAAFHQDVQGVLDAVNALLIWGGRIRVISSHNGEDSAFNQLIKDTRAGKYKFSIHHIPFSAAVKNGLYERVCLMRGWVASAAGKQEWLDRILGSYGPRAEARDEELEAIPRRSSGAYLPRSLVAAAQIEGVPVLRWAQAEDWYLDPGRLDEARLWFLTHVAPVLAKLDPTRRHTLGQDFGRSGDLSVIVIDEEIGGGRWHSRLQVELRNIPFDVQGLLLHLVLESLTRWRAALDARGNGQAHAERAAQRFGEARVECVMATRAWYAEHLATYKAALEDKSKRLPQGEDVLTDHRAAVLVNGLPTIGDERFRGEDEQPRHGDSLVAHLLAHVAGKVAPGRQEFRSLGPRANGRERLREFVGV